MLLFAGRPHLLRSLRAGCSWRLTKALAGDGISYMGAAALANLLVYQWPVYYSARVRPPGESSAFAVQLQLVVLVLSFGISFAQPLWPAIADGVARGDRRWVERAIRRARTIAVAYGLIGFLGIGTALNAIVALWLHRRLNFDAVSCWLAATYVFLAVWEYVHWPVALGLGVMKQASNAVTLRAVAFAAVVPLAARHGGTGLMACLCVSVILLTAWYYPRLITRTLRAMPT